jgi:hypothetical protein
LKRKKSSRKEHRRPGRSTQTTIGKIEDNEEGKFPKISERAYWFGKHAGLTPGSGSLPRLLNALQHSENIPDQLQDIVNLLSDTHRLLDRNHTNKNDNNNQVRAKLIDSKAIVSRPKIHEAKTQNKSIGAIYPSYLVDKLNTSWAILTLPLDPSHIAYLDLETAMLIRSEENVPGEYSLIEASVFSTDDGMMIGRITKPGIYQVFALPKHPWLSTVVSTLSSYWPWIRSELKYKDSSSADQLMHERICTFILCNQNLSKIKDEELIQIGIGTRPIIPEYIRQSGGDICDLCTDNRFVSIGESKRNGELIEPPELKLYRRISKLQCHKLQSI